MNETITKEVLVARVGEYLYWLENHKEKYGVETVKELKRVAMRVFSGLGAPEKPKG